MKKDLTASRRAEVRQLGNPFAPGTLAIVSLNNPRGKFWGMVLAASPAGLSLSGVDLASLEDLAAMMRDGEPCAPAVVFFPMHRVERMELDLPNGAVPSLAERLLASTGLQASDWLMPAAIKCVPGSRKKQVQVKAQTAGQRP